MNVLAVLEIGLLTIVYSVLPLLGIPRLERTIEIPHLVIAFVLAYLTVKGYAASSTLMTVIPPLIVSAATCYAAWVCRVKRPAQNRRKPVGLVDQAPERQAGLD